MWKRSDLIAEIVGHIKRAHRNMRPRLIGIHLSNAERDQLLQVIDELRNEVNIHSEHPRRPGSE